jgi:ABC-type uncharacterized transport system permease subunit
LSQTLINGIFLFYLRIGLIEGWRWTSSLLLGGRSIQLIRYLENSTLVVGNLAKVDIIEICFIN